MVLVKSVMSHLADRSGVAAGSDPDDVGLAGTSSRSSVRSQERCHNPTVADFEYCSYTKAVEFLGDRWCLLIVRDLAMFGPRGFNELATGLPGHISRSTLIDR